MEVEKCLFKIHERTLGVSCCGGFMRGCFTIFFLFSLFSIGLFLFANIKYKDKNDVLKPIYDKIKAEKYNNTDPPAETLFHITVAQFHTNTSNTSQVVIDSLYLNMLVTGNAHVLSLEKEIRSKYNFTQYTIFIPPENFYSNEFERVMIREIISYEALMINQIINTFDKYDKFIKNIDSLELWSFYKTDLENIQWSKEPVKSFFLRLLGVIKIIFGLFLVSNTTSIYIMVTIVSAPILLLSLFECCIRFGNQNQNARLTFYKAFPWIGVYLYALQFNNKKQYCCVMMAFLAMVIIFYTLYISCIMLWNSILFNFSYKRGVDQNFYGFIIILEFFSMLFIRTRTSLRYYPPMIFFWLFVYLFYVNFNAYAMFGPAFLALIFLILTTLTGFLAFLEVPALSWNPSFHYTPSIHKPRCLFFPMFNLSWFYDLPQIWTFFYPLHGRSTFTPAEMSLVDRNYILLNQTLETAVNNPQAMGGNEFGQQEGGQNGGIPANNNNQQNNVGQGNQELHQNYNPQNNL